MVKDAFNDKAKSCLAGTVSDWKEKWQFKGDDVKPPYVTDDVDPHSVKVPAGCSSSRLTKDADGHLPTPHTSGQTPFAGRRLQLVRLFLYVLVFLFHLLSFNFTL